MGERSRILYVQPNSEVGGSDIALLRLVACLDRTRFDPVIVLPGDGPLVQHFRALDAAVHFVPMRQLRTVVSLSHQTSYLTRFWPTVRAVARLIPLIGFVARLDPWKGLHVFLDAARLVSEEFPQAQFLVAGSAPPGYENYETSMRERARSLRLELRVHFLGWRYRLDDIPRLMRSLDVFSHTAVQPEPFGLVLLEAMAASRPVVASKAGGPLEIVREAETGMLAEPGG